MKPTPEDRVLLSYVDLQGLGLLEPTPLKLVRLDRIRELLPPDLVHLAEIDHERLAGIVFRLRIGALSTSEVRFTMELADVIYQFAQRDVRDVSAMIEGAARRLVSSQLNLFVALALYAKQLMLDQFPPIIRQENQIVHCLLGFTTRRSSSTPL